MVPVTPADEELFGTVIAAARFGRVQTLVAHLGARYADEWDDPLAGFPYALSMLAVLQSGRPDVREQLNYTEIIETLSDLLYHEPGHWLGRFLRIHARTLLPVDADEHRGYVAAERTRAAEDAQELIDRQARTAWQPWFTGPYLLAARLAAESDPAGAGPARAGELVAAAAAHPLAPVPFRALGSLMCDPFLWYYAQPGTPAKDTVGALLDALFPDQPAVRRVRAARSR